MKKTFAKIFQQALNRYLTLDPESKYRLQKLQNKIITIELLNVGITMQLIFLHDTIQLNCDAFLTPHTTIKGTPFTLLRMAFAEGDRKHFFSDDVSIEGDLDLGQDVIDLFDQLDIDWEEYLSRWIGDVPAYQVGRTTKIIKNFIHHSRQTVLRNITEYIHEENDWFPPAVALHDFFSDIDILRMDVDRIEARIAQLKNKWGEK